MNSLQDRILQRNHPSLIFDGVGMPLSSQRRTGTVGRRAFQAVFNWSMTFYYGLLFIDALATLAYAEGLLHSKA